MNTSILLQRLLVVGGFGVALTFGALMVLPYGLIFSAVVPSDTLSQATPQPAPEVRTVAYLDDKTDTAESVIDLVDTFVPNVQVIHFLTCEQLVATIPGKKYDAYLLDYFLGGYIYGTECIVEIRALHPNAIIIGYSSEAKTETEFRNAGADHFIDKSSNPLDLPDLLKGILK